MLEDSLSSYFEEFGESCIDVPTVQTPRFEKKGQDEDILVYFVIDKYFRLEPGGENYECVVRIGSHPAKSHRFVHLRGMWSNTDTKNGDICFVETTFETKTDPQDLYFSSLSGVVDDSSGFFTLFPHYMIKVRSLAVIANCVRHAYFRELYSNNEVNRKVIFGRLANEIIQEHVKLGTTVPIRLIADEIIRKNTLLLYSAPEFETEVLNLIDKLVENIGKGLNLNVNLDSVPWVLQTITSQHPGKGVSSVRTHENIWSLDLGMVGRTAVIVETKEGELFPLELYSFGGSENKAPTVSNSHITSMTAHMLLMREKYGESVSEFGFLWYLGSNSRFWIHPTRKEAVALVQARNLLASALVAGVPPPVLQNKKRCEFCPSVRICQQYQSTVENVSESETLDQMSNREFFVTNLKKIHTDSLSVMHRCLEIAHSTLSSRVSKGTAIKNMYVDSIEEVKELKPGASPRVIYILKPSKEGDLMKVSGSEADEAIVTTNGKLPVLLICSISKLSPEELHLKAYEKTLKEGQTVTVDIYKTNRWYPIDNDSVASILSDSNTFRLRETLIRGSHPIHTKGIRLNLDASLSREQRLVVQKAFSTEPFVLVNAIPGSGKMTVVSSLIQTALAQKMNVLISAHFYTTINRLCGVLRSLGIDFVLCGKYEKIEDEFQQFTEQAIFGSCDGFIEVYELMKHKRVFVVSNLHKKFDIITNRHFDMSIVMESSLLSLPRAVPLIGASKTFVLFGDPSYDDNPDSIFNELAHRYPSEVLNLTTSFDWDSTIATFARLIWQPNITGRNYKHSYSLKPLDVFGPVRAKTLRSIFNPRASMVFIDIASIQSTSLIQLSAGLLFESVYTVSSSNHLPFLARSLSDMKRDPEGYFSDNIKTMTSALARIKVVSLHSLRHKRQNVVICYADEECTSILRYALGGTIKKLILCGDSSKLRSSPLWTAVLNQMTHSMKPAVTEEHLLSTEPPLRKLASPVEDIEDFVW